ncbi:alkaline phosphatase family protein [Burkholderia oklahomensis]|uniref:Phosphoesterase family protein n=1 Tax=Burkholderia oklahomensis TaxID=342113 RepID=A0AAI8B3N5_9BURK|nr:alkaline phosphatase family protein [Burkholderia oklahomensis]AIO65137.1 phosphoesterase family protein [Burkholderia oklahomensis]QPS38538.1 phosphoesterase [Burkholderia oklahomensis]
MQVSFDSLWRALRGLFAAMTVVALASCGGADSPGVAGKAAAAAQNTSAVAKASAMSQTLGSIPKIGHVFVIVLENKGYAATFGTGSQAPYLATTLTSQGALLTQYYGIGHNSNDNYLAMVSGQSPNPQTQADCQYYSDWIGTTIPDVNGQVVGSGCVYPPAVQTIANQLETAGLNWRGYMEDMGNDLARDGSATCSHPPLNGQDGTQKATATDGYATRHDPFVYFHSIVDNPTDCNAHVVRLDSLANDLANPNTTPALSFIVPNLCNDGHDDPTCADGTTAGGLPAINDFLQNWVPKITSSAAFKQDGLLIITFDEADTSDASACCGEPAGPNTPLPGITGPGGGLTGAVLLSPFIKGGTVSNTPYNHYALLKSIEDVFGLPYLGYAGMSGLQSFGSDVYTAQKLQ